MIGDDPTASDALAQARAMPERTSRPPIGEAINFDLVEVDRGHAVFEGMPDRSVYNPIGSVHGGYAATLLDSAARA